MRRHIRTHRLLSVLCAGTAAAALVVAAVLRHDAADAGQALPPVVRQLALAEDAPPAAHEALARARQLTGAGRHPQAAQALEELARVAPLPEVHHAAALAAQAAGDRARGARHALSAARLDPEDAAAARRADSALDLATLATVERPLSLAGWIAGGILALLALGAGVRRARRRRIERYISEVSGELRASADGRTAVHRPRIEPWHEHVALDLFLRGRLGMARPTPPRHGPTLRMRLSHATAGQTVRLARVANLRDSAARIKLSPRALAALRAHPGTWRAAAVLGERIVALCDLQVAPGHADGAQAPGTRRDHVAL